MKRLTATFLLLGYALLVPFCFFGGLLAASAHTMDMTGISHAMPMASDCGMQLPCAGGVDPVAHHMSMFNSITQTPLVGVSLLLAILAASLLVIVALHPRFLALFLSPDTYHPPQRADRHKSAFRQSILTWLSLFETSPTFA